MSKRRRYWVTVRYMPREHVLFGALPPTPSGRRDEQERSWTFKAEGGPPPDDRRSIWHVRHRAQDDRVFPVALDMRFVTDVLDVRD